MGMDVFGLNPSQEDGRYFRASVWEWEPIHELMREHCRDLLGDDLLEAIEWNEGEGPTDGATCNVMADRFDDWLRTHGGDYVSLCPKLAIGEFARLVTGCKVDNEATSPYRVDRETLTGWTKFLRACGGFQVY